MNTSSFSFPNMFDVARGKIAVASDRESISSRVKLLILSEPTELYMNPRYGVGLKKYMYQYNNDNVIALIRDNIIEQLRLWEPYVDPDKTIVERGLNYSGSSEFQYGNRLEITVTVFSTFGDEISLAFSEAVEQ